jgi:hypothetical protein
MSATFQNSAMLLSIGIFFTLIIVGLSASLPNTLYHGLVSQGVPQADAVRISHLPPVSSLFAAFLGFNPMQSLLGPAVAHLSPAHAAYLTGRSFFPELISGPFMNGLREAFDFAIGASAVAAVASWLRGAKYHYQEGAELHKSAMRSVEPGQPGDTVAVRTPAAGAADVDTSRNRSLPRVESPGVGSRAPRE